MAEGQTVAISGFRASPGFLAAANNSAQSGTGTIYYTDGTTQSFALDVGNFWYPSGEDGNPLHRSSARCPQGRPPGRPFQRNGAAAMITA